MVEYGPPYPIRHLHSNTKAHVAIFGRTLPTRNSGSWKSNRGTAKVEILERALFNFIIILFLLFNLFNIFLTWARIARRNVSVCEGSPVQKWRRSTSQPRKVTNVSSAIIGFLLIMRWQLPQVLIMRQRVQETLHQQFPANLPIH